MALPVLLDTDIGSDVDDALALALLLRHPGFDGVVRRFIGHLEGVEAEIVTDVDGPAFADWWLESVLLQ